LTAFIVLSIFQRLILSEKCIKKAICILADDLFDGERPHGDSNIIPSMGTPVFIPTPNDFV
jgi:hypothetical protein